MKRLTAVLFASILSLVFLLMPTFLEASGGHGGHGGGHGGSWGGIMVGTMVAIEEDTMVGFITRIWGFWGLPLMGWPYVMQAGPMRLMDVDGLISIRSNGSTSSL